jgi:hypothetical protein
MVIRIIAFLMKFLSDKEVQRHLIETAEKLAKKTNNQTDDEVVSWFKEIWSNK